MNKKFVFLWALYDFANSIVMIVFLLHFSQWLVVDKGVSDLWYNLLFTIGSFLLLLTAPVLGSIADRTGRRQTYLAWITVLTFLAYLATALTALLAPSRVLLVAVLFLIANYFYQFSFVFYNALLHDIAPRSSWGRVSGIGQMGNWLGQIVGLLIALPLANGSITLFGPPGRVQAFLPAVLLFFLFALPLLLIRRPSPEPAGPAIPLQREYAEQWRRFRNLIAFPGMGMFLLAYFFFNDAIITASNNFPIYLEQVFAMDDAWKSAVLLGILFTSAIGSLLAGWVADRIGLVRSLRIILLSWIVVFPFLAFVQSIPVFLALSIVIGALFGAVWSITRAVMTALCPKDRLNFGFSFYTLAERVSTFVGPLAWGLLVSGFEDLGPTRYRIAAASMAVFVAIGAWLLRGVEVDDSRLIAGASPSPP